MDNDMTWHDIQCQSTHLPNSVLKFFNMIVVYSDVQADNSPCYSPVVIILTADVCVLRQALSAV